MSRQSSGNANSPRPPLQKSPRPAYALPRRLSSNPQVQQLSPKSQSTAHRPAASTQDAPPSPSLSSSSSSSSSSPRAIHKSQAFKRPVRFAPSRRSANEPFNLSNSGDADVDNNSDDEDSDAAFLPFSAPAEPTLASSKAAFPDPSATIRNAPAPSALSARRQPSETARQPLTHSSASSNSSQPTNLPQSPQANSRNPASYRSPLVLSPQRAASIAARRRREGSEGTPASMGSSFSDLDDASVTQSALEEALASDLRRGAGSVASRVSGIGQALKSRYL